MSSDLDKLRPAGRIVRAHGLNGSLRVASDFELNQLLNKGEPVFVQMQQGPVPFFVRSIGPVGNGYAVELEWVTSLEGANTLVGRDILLDETLLAHDEGELDVLLGYSVVDNNHGFLGTISEVSQTAAHPIMHIDAQGHEVLIPLVDELIVGLDESARQIIIDAPEGLIDLYLNG